MPGPGAEDYDCEGGGGNGPRYVRGPLEVVGDDPFELDTDDPDDDTPSGGVDSGYGPAAAPEAGASFPLTLVGAGPAVLALLGLGVA